VALEWTGVRRPRPTRTSPIRLWAAAVLPGRDGWSVLKTAPFELLCERSPVHDVPRLSWLAVTLGCEVFQHNLYDSSGETMVEAAADGSFFVSGFNPGSRDAMHYMGFEMTEESYRVDFRLLDLPELRRLFSEFDSLGEGRAVEFAERFWLLPTMEPCLVSPPRGSPVIGAAWGNDIQVDLLIPHHPLDVPSCVDAYWARRPAGEAQR
jgi:hypothetical protein